MSKRNISDLTELLKQWDGTDIMQAIKALPPAKRAKVVVRRKCLPTSLQT